MMFQAAFIAVAMLAAASVVAAGDFDGWSTGRATHVRCQTGADHLSSLQQPAESL
jgi:hypothetical protein